MVKPIRFIKSGFTRITDMGAGQSPARCVRPPAKGPALAGPLHSSELHRVALSHDHRGPDRDPLVEILDVVVGHAEAAG